VAEFKVPTLGKQTSRPFTGSSKTSSTKSRPSAAGRTSSTRRLPTSSGSTWPAPTATRSIRPPGRSYI